MGLERAEQRLFEERCPGQPGRGALVSCGVGGQLLDPLARGQSGADDWRDGIEGHGPMVRFAHDPTVAAM